MIGDDDEEDSVQESKDTDEGIVQHQVIFPSIHNAIVMNFELLFQKFKSIKKIIS